MSLRNSTPACLLLFVSLFLINTIATATPLSGTYTIDATAAATATNFKNISSVITYMSGNSARIDAGPANSAPFGVSGPVVFNIAAGTYTERLIINAIAGTSQVNTITFQSATGSASSVVLTNNLTSTGGFLIAMTRADYFVFKNITFTPTSTNSLAIGAISTSFCSGDSIVNCILNNSTSNNSTTTNIARSKNIVFKGNTFNSSANHFTGSLDTTTTIINNTFINPANNTTAISLTEGEGFKISDNFFTAATSQGFSGGIQVVANSGTAPVNPCRITGNKISGTVSFGIQVSSGYYSSANRLLVANNFLYLTQGSGIDLYGYYSGTNVNVFFNSINHTGTFGSCLSTGTFGNSFIKDNIFINNVSGTSVKLYYNSSNSPSFQPTLDYNDYYSADTTKYAGIRSLDPHAIFESVPFTSATDLHHLQACLKGFPLAEVTTDVDGETRDATSPTRGADEVIPASFDAGITRIISPNPNGSIVTGTPTNISFKVRNYGSSTINTLEASYNINGTIQTQTFTGLSIATCDSATLNFSTPYTFMQESNTTSVFTGLVNGNADGNPSNNTADANIYGPMNGVYTVNPAAPITAFNFKTIGQADTALMNRSVSGPVEIKIYNGIYNQSGITLGTVGGSSPANTITFSSFSNDSLQVQITSPLTFTGTSNVIIKRLNLDQVTVNGAVTDYIISNNQIRNFSWIAGDNVKFINNYIKPQNGFTNLTLPPPAISFASKSGAYINNIRVENNFFRQVTYFNNAGVGTTGVPNAINWTNVRRPAVKNNTFRNINMINVGYGLIGCCTYTTYPYGATFQFDKCVDTAFVEGNKFDSVSTDRLVNDINMSNQNDATGRLSLIVIRNNFFSVAGGLSTASYGAGAASAQFYFNNVNTVGSGSGPYFDASISVMKNNVFSATNGKKAFTYSSHPGNSDYNDFYTSGSVLVTNITQQATTNYATFSQYQSATGTNANSKNVNPKYYDSVNLHVKHPALLAAGTPFPVPDNLLIDIDNDNRNQLNPCIGADEFQPAGADVVALQYTGPKKDFAAVNLNPLKLKFVNNGSAALNQVNVRWSVDGVEQIPYSWTGSLLYDSTTEVTFGNYSFPMVKYTNLKIWTDLPNGVPDMVPANDTIKVDSIMPFANGDFTLGGVTPHFQNFTKANELLAYGGVNGAVTVAVRSGKYVEQPVIKYIRGGSLTNTIIFKGEANMAAQDTLSFTSLGTGTNKYATLRVDSAAYVTFKNITLQSLSQYSREVEFINKCRFITFDSCTFTSAFTNPTYAHVESDAPVFGIVPIDSNVVFTNNYFKNGGAGITLPFKNGLIKGNRFDNLYNGDAITISGNFAGNNSLVIDSNYVSSTQVCTFSFGGACYSYGYNSIGGISITASSAGNNISITRNRVYAVNRRGINVSSNGTATNPVKIYNNFVAIRGSVLALSSNGTYADINFNSFGDSANTNSDLVQLSSTNTSFRNNILVKGVQGTTAVTGSNLLNVSSNSISTLVSTNNAYATPDSLKTIYNGSASLTLGQWKTTSGKDLNSVKTSNSFINAGNDLHIDKNKPGAVDLAKKAIAVAGLLRDIDDSTRSTTTPCIGADEFSLNDVDAGALDITAPVYPMPQGVNNVIATIRNYGSIAVTSATVNWSVNGTVQSPGNYSGTIASGDSAKNITLGSFDFASAGKYDIKVWTSNVNGGGDANALNDTASRSVYPALCGNYTVAGTAPAFSTLNAAVKYAALAGITCPSVFNIRDGLYNENDTITAIAGSSAINTLTIQGESMDSSKVAFYRTDYENNNSPYSVIRIDNAKYLKFKNISFRRTSPGANHFYFDVVVVAGTPTGLSFSNCELATTGAGSLFNCQYTSGSPVATDINFNNNNFISGSNAITINGGFQNYLGNVTIRNNNFRKPLPAGSSNNSQVYLTYLNSPVIEDNFFDSSFSGTGYLHGIYLQNSVGKVSIRSNKVVKRKASYGIYLSNVAGFNHVDSAAVVANNFATTDSTGNFAAMYLESIGRNVKVAYNNLLNNSTGTSSYALYFSHSYGTGTFRDTIVNNNITNTNAGFALFQSQISNSDVNATNNNIWSSSGSRIATYNNTTYNTLAALATASGTHAASVSVNPLYVGNSDLHINELGLRTSGKPLGYITKDIDGDVRGTVSSTIGADEVVVNNNDAGITTLVSPAIPFAAGNRNVSVTIKNYGSSALTSVVVNWSVNGVMQPAYNYSGSITFNTTQNVVIGTANFVIDSAFNIKAWTSSPNGATDASALNDTLLVTNLYPALSGSYTIGGVTPDFKTFARSSTSLKYGGVLGNVIFNARDGRYNETMLVDSIPFQNNFNITWQSESGDSSKVVMGYVPVLNDNTNAVLQLNNTKNITVRRMTIQVKIPAVSPSASYKSLVYFSKRNKNLQLVSNQFIDSTFNTADNTGGSRFFYNTDVINSTQTLNARSLDSAVTIDRNNFKQVNLSTAVMIDLGGTSQTDFGGNTTVFSYLNNLIISNNRNDLKLLSKPVINITYSDSVRVTGNKISGTLNLYGKDLLLLDKNEIYHEGNSQNVVTINSTPNRVAGKPVIVSNNTIQSVRTGFFNGVPVPNVALYITGDRVNVVHNTIATNDTGNVTGYGFGAAMALASTKLDTVKNNIFYNVNGGYLINTNSLTSLVSNNNDYVYTNNFATNAANLAQYRTLYGQDAQSVENINPYFRGPKDLHASNINLKAAPVVSPGSIFYLSDVDGQARGSVSCYGADEFTQPANDLIVLDASPKRIFPEGVNDVKIRVYNNGSNAITSFSATAGLLNFPVSFSQGINAGSINYNWTGNLAPGAETTITLGQLTVPLYRNQFKVNTSNLNGIGDEVPHTDSLQNDNFYAGLNGAYTMRDAFGSNAPATFTAFNDAAIQLKMGGVWGPSTLNVLPGLWNAYFYADSIPNRGVLSPLTIQSQNGDSSTTGFYTNSFHAFTMYRANNVTIKRLLFGSPANDPTYSGMTLGWNSQNITVQNCKFLRIPQIINNVSLGGNQLIIGTNWAGQTGYTDSNYVIKNNYFENANRGIYLFGYDAKPARNFVITNNTLLNQGSYGMDLQLVKNVTVDSNIISTNSTDPAYLGLKAESITGKVSFTKNRIYIEKDGTGIKTLEGFLPPYSPTDTLLIANNFVTTGAAQASVAVDVQVNRGAKSTRIFHNSLLNRSSSASAISLKTAVSVSGKFEVLNNIMFNKKAGMALSVTKSGGITYVQHNDNPYTAGAVLAQVNGVNYNNLSALSSTGIDYSSVSGDPLFISDIDLHVDGAIVNSTGSYDAYNDVTTDIDNEKRSSSAPDIGADEFNLPNFGVVQFETPLSSCSHTSTEIIKVWVKNFGTAPRSNVPVAYRFNNGAIVRDTVRTLVNPADSVLFAFTQTANLAAPTNYYFDAWTEYRGDSLPANDTLKQFLVATTPANNILPYYTGFEGTNAGWYTGGQNSSFKWGVVFSGIIDSAANGLNAWKTSLSGPHNNNEFSYLYSPCFDLSSVTTDPTLNFNLAYQLENNMDKAWLEYSTDGGSTWAKLGAQGEGLAWYNNAGDYWTGLNKAWHNAKHILPVSGISDRSKIRIRFVMQSNSSIVQDGIAIDDISIYTGANPPVSGGTYVNRTATSTGSGTFIPVNDPAGNRLVEINDNGQTLGTITVDVKQNSSGTPTNYNGGTYLGRNWVIRVQNQPTTPVKVRLFFTQAEVDAWRAADSTIDLMRNISVYKYSGIVEDFSLANNSGGSSLILSPAQLTKIPYLDGYFLEFSVSSFSEFWLTKLNEAPQPVSITAGQVLINQFNPGYNTATDEYIELVNTTGTAIDLSMLKVVHQSASGATGTAGGVLSGTLAPHSFWLLSPNAAITAGQTTGVARDGAIASGFDATGQLALQRVTDNGMIDGFAYGSISGGNLGEGTSAPAATGSNGYKRTIDGDDSNANSSDFSEVSVSNIYLRNGVGRLANTDASIAAGNYTDLVVTGISSLAGSVTVSKVLDLKRGNLNTNNTLTLTSNAANTARVGQVSVGATVSGNVTVERFIPAKRAWRLLNAPLSTAATQTVRAAWQEGGDNSPGFGTHITGGTTADGFDQNPSNSSSIKIYNQVSNEFDPLPSTLSALKSQSGYFLFVRGDRTIDLVQGPAAGPANTILRSTGPLKTGDTTIAVANANFTLLGNPYASPVDFSLLTHPNVANRFYAWDPKINAVGAYVTVDDVTNSGTYTIIPNGSAQTKVLEPGQAFFVQPMADAAFVTFTESSKSAASTKAGFRTNGGVSEVLRTNLYLKNKDNTTALADAVLAEYNNNFSAAVSFEDAPKMTNINENLAIERNGQALSIERRPLADASDTLFLKLWNTTARSYQFEFIPANFPSLLSAFFEDNYLKTNKPLSLLETTRLDFDIAGDTASSAPNRFRIVFKSGGVLTSNLIDVKASRNNAGINVDWSAANESNIRSYEVEKSANGQQFTKATSVTARANTNSTGVYNWYDANPNSGNNFYRIKVIENNGSMKYTAVVNVMIGSSKAEIVVYPNPVKGKMLGLHLNNQDKGSYIVQMFNSLGQQVYSKVIEHPGGSVTQNIQLGSTVSPGIYQLKITNGVISETLPVILE